jgi:hypothetical protein
MALGRSLRSETPPMQRSDGLEAADGLLTKLLERHESRADRRNSIAERMPTRSWLADDREALYGRLKEAVDSGAVELEFGKLENRHNIQRVILTDPDPLYGLLRRARPTEVASSALTAVRLEAPNLGIELSKLLEEVAHGWAASRNAIRGIQPDDPMLVARIFQAAQALLDGITDGTGFRQFSRRVSGDTKFVGSNIGRIADVLRRVRDFPEDYAPEEVLETLGLKRTPRVCLLSGPVSYRGEALPTNPYIGLAPEMIDDLGVVSEPQWLLTVENLESFERQVREARPLGAVVIYTGGFPSDATLAAILKLAAATSCPFYHWGDIDSGGLRIAHRIDRALAQIGRSLELHLMSTEIAESFGKPGPPVHAFLSTSGLAPQIAHLAAFLASERSRFLEQEELDPSKPALPARSHAVEET